MNAINEKKDWIKKVIEHKLHTTHRWAWCAKEGKNYPFEITVGEDTWNVLPGENGDGSYSQGWTVVIWHDFPCDGGHEEIHGDFNYGITDWNSARDSYQVDRFKAYCDIKNDIEKGDFFKVDNAPVIAHHDEDPEKCWTVNLTQNNGKDKPCDWVIYHADNEFHYFDDPWYCEEWSKIAYNTIVG